MVDRSGMLCHQLVIRLDHLTFSAGCQDVAWTNVKDGGLPAFLPIVGKVEIWRENATA